MSNLIKFKRGSGSDPSTSDLVVGEVAIRTDNGKLFTKKDDGSIAEISGSGGSGISDGDKGDITVSNSGDTFTIDSGVIADGNIASNAAIALSKLATGTLPSGLKVNHNNLQTGIIEDENISSSAAIAGSKISPIFGSQDIKTTGDIKAEGASSLLMVGDTGNDNYVQLTQVTNSASVRGFTNQHSNASVLENLQGTTNQHLVLGDVDATNSGTLFGISHTTSGTTVTRLSLSGSGNLDVHNNITLGGTVDGRDVAADGTKLDGIESGATADQTAAEIRTLVGNASDSNVFTDALLSKLNGIAASATNVTNNNQLTNGAGYITATLTQEQVEDFVGGMLTGNTETGITVTYQDSDGTIDFSVASQTDNNFTNALLNKLNGIEAGATADQTASDIKTLLQASKLTGNEIADSAIGSAKIADGAIVNADVNASAAIAGSKISPTFTSDLTVEHSGHPTILIHDTSGDNQCKIQFQTDTYSWVAGLHGGENRWKVSKSSSFGTNDYLEVDDGGSLHISNNIIVGGTVDGVDIAALNTTVGNLSLSGSTLADGTTATTQAQTDNSTKVSTTAYVRTAISDLVNSAPSTLNTLKELSDALGSDANFSTTVTNSIATKLPLAGGTLTGDLTISEASPAIFFTDNAGSPNNPDYRLQANAGTFIIYDQTNSVTRLQVNTDGHIDITGNLDVGAGLDVTGNITVSGTVDGRDVASDGSKLDGIAAGATNVTNTNQLTNGAGFITATLTNEQVQDIVGGMVTGNTETGITVTYQDSDGTLDFAIGTLGTSNIANNAVDFSKMQDIGAGRIIGNASGSTANPDQLTAAQVRTIINVEDGATADQTASEILTLIKTVDGAGSGLDADTIDGLSSASFLRSDTTDTFNCNGFALEFDFDTTGRNSLAFKKNGTTHWQLVHDNSGNDLNFDRLGASGVFKVDGNRVLTTADEGNGNGIDADTVDGLEASVFVKGNGTNNNATEINVSDADFIVEDTTDSITNFIWRRHSTSQLYLGTATAVVTARSHVNPDVDSTYNLGANGTRWANIYGDQLHGAGSNITNLNGANITDNTITNAKINSMAASKLTGALPAIDGSNLTGIGGGGHFVCHLKSNTTASVGSSAAVINFNQESNTDSSKFSHSSGAITVLETGWYTVKGSVVYQSSATSRRNTIKTALTKNGSAVSSADTYTYIQPQIEPIIIGHVNSDGTKIKGEGFSVTRNGDGDYTITFSTAMPDANYVVNGQIQEGTARDDIKIHVRDGSQTTTSFRVYIYEGDNGTTADVLRNRDFYFTVSDVKSSWGRYGSATVDTTLYLTANDVLRITTNTVDEAGTTTIVGSSSEFIVTGLQLSSASTNADTVDGYHASSFVIASAIASSLLPASTNSIDLGSASKRWANLYVNDMHFSNEGKQNDVDGTWGDWTLQEGESDIFMINNRTGKKFKIAMIPV